MALPPVLARRLRAVLAGGGPFPAETADLALALGVLVLRARAGPAGAWPALRDEAGVGEFIAASCELVVSGLGRIVVLC